MITLNIRAAEEGHEVTAYEQLDEASIKEN